MADHRRSKSVTASKNSLRVLLISTGLLITALLLGLEIWHGCEDGSALENVRVRSEDLHINITWETTPFSRIREVEITVKGDNFKQTVSVPAGRGEWSFRNGEFGKLYTIVVRGVYPDGTYGEETAADRLFLDESRLPDLPLIRLETVDGRDPTFEIVQKDNEEIQWGSTITGNEYVVGSISIENDQILPPSAMQIRVRGNTSALANGRVPYKMKLETKLDLLELGGDYAEKEWLLLNCGESLNLYLGFLLSDQCGLEWRPQMRFVNVILNGDWKGLYILTEPVQQIVTQLPISESGYLFENDAYWYNSDGIYFKTRLQLQPFGFTFKYPKLHDAADERVAILQAYMENLEWLMENDIDTVFDYIDEDSFATWTLVKDIAYIIDASGSNMYYYIQSLDPHDPTVHQLKLGPVWDFDITFGSYYIDASSKIWGQYKDLTEGWSWQHSWFGTYTNYLMQNPYFYSRYTELWHTVRTDLLRELSNRMDALQEMQGDALNESRRLNAARWHIKTILLEDEIAYEKAWLADRIAWIDSQLGTGE